ncbi:MAG: GPR endopeptidase [Clostridiales bacterium]|nr:GPR endopeptidase [Clostridiales bacterium]
MLPIETDLILEATELWRQRPGDPGELPGVATREYQREGFPVTEVRVLDQTGAEAVGKPVGTYLTVETGRDSRAGDYPERAAEAVAGALRGLLPRDANGSALVVGLGNRAITPDAVGPWAVDHTVVTRHLVARLPETFGDFRPVAAVATGVLGSTGVESGELVKALCQRLRPAVVVAIDALAARSARRLCSTIQLADTGIVPGSGVGNARFALTREELGVPVLAVGVPTVVRAATLAADLGADEGQQQTLGSLLVTPKDIDALAAELEQIIGCGVTMGLQEGLTPEDVAYLLR